MKNKFYFGLILGILLTISGIYLYFRDLPCLTIKNIDGINIIVTVDPKCETDFLENDTEIWVFLKNAYGYFCQGQFLIINNEWNVATSGFHESRHWQLVFISFKITAHDSLLIWRDQANQIDQNQILNLTGRFLHFIPAKLPGFVDKVFKFFKPYDVWITLLGLISSAFSIYSKWKDHFIRWFQNFIHRFKKSGS